MLEQGRIRLVLTGTLTGEDEIAAHHKRHGDGVHSIALSVPDAAAAYEHAVAHGARGLETPYELSDEDGTVRLASVQTYGETRHLFVERAAYSGAFLPGFERRGTAPSGRDGLLFGIDHVVGNVELGHMQEWVGYYERVFGMTELIHFSDEAISTEYSALMSKVVTDGSGRIKFPINEPAQGKRKSQIEEYLDFYRGAGVQHIAVSTTDIVHSVTELAERGVEFLPIPESYYADVPGRIGEIDEDVADLQRLGHPGRPRRRGLPAADLHQGGRRPADGVLRADRAPRRPRLRRGQLQGAVRGARARAGPPREPLVRAPR